MSAHTPLRWKREGNHIVAGASRVCVVDTPDIHCGVDWAEAEANSDLIAAAPELKAIAEAIETRIGFSPDPMLGPGSPVARALLAALRKARGAA